MDEIKVVLVDEQNKERGFMEKQEAHIQGELHRAFSVFLYHDNKMLIQRRALHKYHCGGMWANTCCSHPRHNEVLEVAVKQRLVEEMGIHYQGELIPAFDFTYRATFENGLIEHEYDHVFIGEFSGEYAVNKDEVDEGKWIEIEQLEREILENEEMFCPWFLIALPKVLELIIEE